MGRVAILFGILLSILGVGFYIYTEMLHPTALIPTGFGIVFIVLGVFAQNDKLRMHVMHVAALVGLIGVAIPAFMVSRKLAGGGSIDNSALEQIIFAVLCAVFLVLCVKSFIDARRRRKQAQTP